MNATVEYAPGRLLDVHGEAAPVTVLLWHGRGPNEREVLSPFADLIAADGFRVVVPDWDSTADDGGRRDLLLSIRYVRELEAPFLIAGWSLGGAAAASLALSSRKLSLGNVPVVTLAGGFSKEDPLSGAPFAELTIPERNQGSITLLRGTLDDIVPENDSPDFHARLQAARWTTELIDLEADHAGVVGAAYDRETDICVPVPDSEPGRQAARIVSEAAALLRPKP